MKKEKKILLNENSYKIVIDRQEYIFKDECLSGRELLIRAGKIPPEKFQLNKKLRNGKIIKVNYYEWIHFTVSDFEKFITIPLDQTEG